ncbi:hypothetical protein JOC34_000466 [Virgibacillus halotolerans]|nr:hypothetical protein [Virgibacillus halotolerans]
MPEFLHKRDGESVDDYHIRLFENKDDYDIDKYTITNLLNEAAGTNYDESKWRKDYSLYIRWKDYILQNSLDQERLALYEESRIEQEKEKIRKQDQKREYQKMLRNSARFENIQIDVRESIFELEKVKPLHPHEKYKIHVNDEKHGLALFSDWHFGSEVDNNHNKYNKEIFDLRVRELVDKIIRHGTTNNISTLHIAQLGDLINGLIHVSARVQANETLVGQIQHASERLAEVINKLASVFPKIVYYNVIGNHARTSPNKSDVGLSENFEYLVPWFLEARLSHLDNVEMIVDKDGYVEANIFDSKMVFVHGNFDQADKAVTRLPQLLGYVPDFIVGGHVHHNYMKEYGKTTTLVNGSLIGLDDYATQGRFGGSPSQKFIVFDENYGMECEYIIKFKN